MDCNKVLERLCDDIADDIDAKLCQELALHIEKCEFCQNQLGSVKSTVKLFQCLKDQDVPETVHSRLAMLLNLPK